MTVEEFLQKCIEHKLFFTYHWVKRRYSEIK